MDARLSSHSSPYVVLAHYGELDWVSHCIQIEMPSASINRVTIGSAIRGGGRSCKDKRWIGRYEGPDICCATCITRSREGYSNGYLSVENETASQASDSHYRVRLLAFGPF